MSVFEVLIKNNYVFLKDEKNHTNKFYSAFVLSSFILKSNSSTSVVSSTNFSQHIAPIFYANCTGCHHSGELDHSH